MANLLIRKKLAALKEAARGAMRPDGQGDVVLGMLDRVKDANRRAEEGNAGAFRIHLSRPVIAAILVVMAVSVGWTWYMGYMVGQGQDPVIQAGRLAQTALPGVAAPEADPENPVDADQPAPSGEIVEPEQPARGAPAAAAARNAAQKAGAGTPAPAAARDAARAAKAAPPAAKAKDQPRADTRKPGDARKAEAAKADTKRAETRKPDARKADEAKRADARKADAKKDAKRADEARKAGTKKADAGKADDAGRDAARGQRFSMVFQVGAFKGPVDSGRLRERLEAKGFRASVRPSGKVFLVTVSLRGDAKAADRLRAEARKMGLGDPVLLSRKEAGGR